MQCLPEMIFVVKSELGSAQDTIQNHLNVMPAVVISIFEDPDKLTQGKRGDLQQLSSRGSFLYNLCGFPGLRGVILGQIPYQDIRI